MGFLGHFGGIITVKAGGAITLALVAAGNLLNIVNAEVAEAVNADNLGYFLNAVMTGDQIVTGINVRAVIAGIEERRCGNTHMDFLCACISEQFNYSGAGRTSDYRVVYHNNSFAFDNAGYRIELDAHLIGTALLTGGNECSSDVFILNETYFIGNTRLL